MAFSIQDGRTHDTAQVNSANQLIVRAITEPDVEHTSEQVGRSYTWSNLGTASTATDLVHFYLQNTDPTRDLHIAEITIGSSIGNKYTVKSATGTAAGGDTFTSANLNLISGNIAKALCRSDSLITGVTDLVTLGTVWAPAFTTVPVAFDEALILGDGDAFTIELAAIGTPSFTIVGFYPEGQ